MHSKLVGRPDTAAPPRRDESPKQRKYKSQCDNAAESFSLASKCSQPKRVLVVVCRAKESRVDPYTSAWLAQLDCRAKRNKSVAWRPTDVPTFRMHINTVTAVKHHPAEQSKTTAVKQNRCCLGYPEKAMRSVADAVIGVDAQSLRSIVCDSHGRNAHRRPTDFAEDMLCNYACAHQA
jgi:hypothetical protein